MTDFSRENNISSDQLQTIREKWDTVRSIDPSQIPFIQLITHEATESIEITYYRLLDMIAKRSSIKGEVVDQTKSSLKESINLLAHDAIKIGFEYGHGFQIGAHNFELDEAWDDAAEIFVQSRSEVGERGVKLVKSAAKKELLTEEQISKLSKTIARSLEKCQRICFRFGYLNVESGSALDK